MVQDLIHRWGAMESVAKNKVLSESWVMTSGSGAYATHPGVWCYGATVPIDIFFRFVLGLEPLSPGWKTFSVAPQLGELDYAEGTAHTPYGPIHCRVKKEAQGRVSCQISCPAGLSPRFAKWVTAEVSH